jgi:hypothetical protein
VVPATRKPISIGVAKNFPAAELTGLEMAMPGDSNCTW